ncbi:MAG: hypothetical protein GY772_09300 [bacterium]|nr:hypothetical protein [bacterium]
MMMAMDEDQWKTLDGCVGPETTEHLKAVVSALRQFPEVATTLQLDESSDLQALVGSLKVISNSEEDALPANAEGGFLYNLESPEGPTLRIGTRYCFMVENMADAVDFAMANGALTGGERPLA